jgi:hypothetical protein
MRVLPATKLLVLCCHQISYALRVARQAISKDLTVTLVRLSALHATLLARIARNGMITSAQRVMLTRAFSLMPASVHRFVIRIRSMKVTMATVYLSTKPANMALDQNHLTVQLVLSRRQHFIMVGALIIARAGRL